MGDDLDNIMKEIDSKEEPKDLVMKATATPAISKRGGTTKYVEKYL